MHVIEFGYTACLITNRSGHLAQLAKPVTLINEMLTFTTFDGHENIDVSVSYNVSLQHNSTNS